MKYLITLSAIFFFHFNLISQVKKSSNKSDKPEIDQLYEKYKGQEAIILYTPYGEINGEVTIKLNPDNKPEAIRINITTENEDAAAKFIYDLIKQKLKAKYKDPSAQYRMSWEFESIKHNLETPNQFKEMRENYLFEKGKMYTKIIVRCSNCEYGDSGDKIFYVEIETGDKSRAGGKKASAFEF